LITKSGLGQPQPEVDEKAKIREVSRHIRNGVDLFLNWGSISVPPCLNGVL
jgi:hypothetical protein